MASSPPGSKAPLHDLHNTAKSVNSAGHSGGGRIGRVFRCQHPLALDIIVDDPERRSAAAGGKMTLPGLKPRGFFPVPDRIRNMELALPTGC